MKICFGQKPITPPLSEPPIVRHKDGSIHHLLTPRDWKLLYESYGYYEFDIDIHIVCFLFGLIVYIIVLVFMQK